MNRKKKKHQHKCKSILEYYHTLRVFNHESAMYFREAGLKELEEDRKILEMKGIRVDPIYVNRYGRRGFYHVKRHAAIKH